MGSVEIYFAGIIEDKEGKDTIRYIGKLLSHFGYNFIYSNGKGNIIYLNKKNIVLVIIYMNPKDIDIFGAMGIKFDFLIHNFMKEEDYRQDIVMEQFVGCKYYILNSDDKNWTLLPLGSFDGIVITYGFNSKATLTISSYNINQMIKANLCLQREIISIWEKRIEPFEFTVEVDSDNRDNIYPILAASILSFILWDSEISLKDYKSIKI
ncbi:MAG: hypothetical protein AB2375_07115 [Tissierellaceae bacterium]